MKRRALALVVAVVTMASGCASQAPVGSGRKDPAITTPLPISVRDPAPLTTTPTGPLPCNPFQSFRPRGLPAPGKPPAGSTMEKIVKNGKLRLGIGTGGNLLTFPNPNTGKMEGFEAEIAREIAFHIFGRRDDSTIQFRSLNAAERIPTILRGEVDMVMAAMTMTCERWKDISFSADYYTAGQKILVNRGSAIKSKADLGGKKVCASQSGTNIPVIQHLDPKPIAVGALNTGDCLLMLQQWQIDAVSTGDVILAGLAAQDPGTVILSDRLTTEPTGIGISKESEDLVRFVNAILEKLKADGTWTALQRKWLAPVILEANPPVPQYKPE